MLYKLLFLGVLFSQKNNPYHFQPYLAVYQIPTFQPREYFPREDIALLLIGYPLGKNDSHYYIFINRKKITRINPGEKIMIQIKNEATYQVCIAEKATFQEPATLSSNSRTISMKPGKQYYFLIGKKEQLDYIFNAETGAKAFNKASDYKSANPAQITASETGEIPSL